jgi:hypothetical protein
MVHAAPEVAHEVLVGIGRLSKEFTIEGVLLAVNTRAGDFFSSSMSGCRVTLVDEFISWML